MLDVNNKLAGYDIAIFDFGLRYDTPNPEPVVLTTVELCHRVSPTEPSATVGPVTSSDFCEDINMSITNAWSRGTLVLTIDETTVQTDYSAGDYIEIGFTHPISFANSVALYYPLSVANVVDLGNNVYRFYLTEGWIGGSIPVLQAGQLDFVGSVAHVPDISWSQICEKEGGVETTLDPPTTVDPVDEPTSDEFCEELDAYVQGSWKSGTMTVYQRKVNINQEYSASDHIEIQFDSPVNSWSGLYFPVDVTSGNNIALGT